jgi:integrase
MPKRGQNEGSIYKRKDGRWAAAVSLGYQNGKLKRKTLYGKTRKEVQDKLTVTLRNVQQGIPVADERQTVRQFLDRWLVDFVKPSVRPKTFSSYSEQIRLHINPELGHIQLAKLSPHHIQAFLNGRLKKGLSPRTVQYHRTVLRIALGQAMKWGLVVRNVAALVDPPRAERFDTKPICAEEARALLQSIQGDRLEALFTVALSLGLRRGEALGLRWEDIDFQTRTLRINAALQRIDHKLQLSEPKTKGSRRILDLPDSLINALRAHRTRQLEEKLLAGSKWQEMGLVFTTTLGTPIDPRNVKRRFDALLKKAGLPHYRIHDLRHFCASLLLAQGVPFKVVSDILGHSQISTTADLYTHVLPSLRREAIDLMESVLTGKK